jgi:CBS domain containing-hemolysin-like protein
MTLLFVYLALAIIVSFLCSLLESVILSVSPAYIAVLEKENHKRAGLLSDLKDNIDRPLAAILTLNTIAHTVGAAGVGAQVLVIWGDSYVALGSALLTVAILVFSEIIPKTLGAVYAKKLALICAPTINLFIYVTYPLVILSEVLRDIVDRQKHVSTTREEVMVAAEIGVDEGAIRKNESLVIQNILTLNKIEVSDIMTPRSVVFALDGDDTVGDVFQEHKSIEFSRIPVFKENTDHVIGMILRYKLMEAYSQDLDHLKIETFIKPIHSVPETISVAACMDQFIKRKDHIFLVVDEYGGLEGIVTLEDVVETLLGVEIVDEFDSVEDLRKHARDLWQNRKNALSSDKRTSKIELQEEKA